MSEQPIGGGELSDRARPRGGPGSRGSASTHAKLTPRQALAGEIRLANPSWSERKVLDAAGYSGQTDERDLPEGGSRALARRIAAAFPPALRRRTIVSARTIHAKFAERVAKIAEDPSASESALLGGYKLSGEIAREQPDEDPGVADRARATIRRAAMLGQSQGLRLAAGRPGLLGYTIPVDDDQRLRRLAIRAHLRRDVDDEIEAHPRTIDVEAVRVEPGTFTPTKRIEEGRR